MAFVVTEPCVGIKDHACVDVCPVDCIYEGEEHLLIHPEECIDCGACVPECPVEAIFEVAHIPDQWRTYIARNADPFQRNTDPPRASLRDQWEMQRIQDGTPAHSYYVRYGKA
jgi:NAD-dependent dihydropyrimidine dehydrogenase PreA subunit